ncbi:hypothetical protein HMPREF0580_1652 [Mobiluncus mulieris ATCC 35239]|uniref:Uncharacterized protein n=1 Tax=Mobiluncus mulieris ATCC 35239 TaxID=871571 RepID=E0QRY7_9ACTO|nr:hypothetical protein HMPREF0580_1652 [Mobiluncus mulieris ATCC 35239]
MGAAELAGGANGTTGAAGGAVGASGAAGDTGCAEGRSEPDLVAAGIDAGTGVSVGSTVVLFWSKAAATSAKSCASRATSSSPVAVRGAAVGITGTTGVAGDAGNNGVDGTGGVGGVETAGDIVGTGGVGVDGDAAS